MVERTQVQRMELHTTVSVMTVEPIIIHIYNTVRGKMLVLVPGNKEVA